MTFHTRVPTILRGAGGRASTTGKTITIFGATGFLARYVVNCLGRSGWTIHIACRGDDMEWRHLKPLCDHGKLIPHYYSAKDEASIAQCLPPGQVDVVLNLIGKQYETKHMLPWWINNTFEDTHIKATQSIATAARRAGVEHFVQMSCAKASVDSPNIWAKTKALGEIEAQKHFPGACIVRSGQLYGPEDPFLNKIAALLKKSHIFRIPEEGRAKISPVFVLNVAEALVPILYKHKDFAGETVHLLGKDEFTLLKLVEFVDQTVGNPKTRHFVTYDMDSPLLQMYGKMNDLLPSPSFSLTQLEQLCLNDRPKADHELDWEAVGVKPARFEDKAYNVLYRYRQGGHFRELRALEDYSGHVSHRVGHVGVKGLET